MQGSGVRSTLKLGNAGNMEQTALWLIGLLKPDSRGSLAMRHEDGGGMGGVGGGSSSVLTLTLTLTYAGELAFEDHFLTEEDLLGGPNQNPNPNPNMRIILILTLTLI